jgi:DNA-binding GntR family transcriptional regulator
VPRRGIFIVRKTKREIVEMIEVWAALESMAARLATIHASDQEIAALRHMFDEFASGNPADHIDEYSDANIAFHQAIIKLSGSTLMTKSIETLFIHVRAIRRRTISQQDRAARSIVEHTNIIEALERRDTSSPSASCASIRWPRGACRKVLRFPRLTARPREGRNTPEQEWQDHR